MSNNNDCRLTPRTIYRWVNGAFDKDHPDLAMGFRMKGMTLVRFWRELLSSVLPEDALDMLDSADGNRSRSLSNIMNRTGSSGVQSPLYFAFSKGFDHPLLLHLTVSWLDMLQPCEPDWVLFEGNVTAFEKMCAGNDDAVTPEIQEHLLSLRADDSDSSYDGYQRLAFVCCMRLAWLTVYAFLGNGMGKSKAYRVRNVNSFTVGNLLMRYRQVTFGRFVPAVLTTKECDVCSQALAGNKYVQGIYGNADRLFVSLESRGKVLVSASDGMGKTELARQLLVKCEESGRYSRVAFVDGAFGLIPGFRKAFPELKTLPDDDITAAVREILDRKYSGRTLLIIDDMRPVPASGNSLTEISRFGCDVLITSQMRELEGFETFILEPLGAAETKKLFSNILGYPVPDTDEEIRTLRNRVNGHTLALILLAKTMKANTMTVADLNRRIASSGFDELRFVTYGDSEKIIDRLKSTFVTSMLDERSKKLLALFSSFGTGKMKAGLLKRMLADIEPDPGTLTELLYRMHLCGWLELDRDGYFMQPVIAEVMRAECGSLREYPLLEDHLRELFTAQDELFRLREDGIPAAEAALFFAGKRNAVPDGVLRGAAVYVWYVSASRQLLRSLAEVCAGSDNRETRFIGCCFLAVCGIRDDRFGTDENAVVAGIMEKAGNTDLSEPLTAAGIAGVVQELSTGAGIPLYDVLSKMKDTLPNGVCRGLAWMSQAERLLKAAGDLPGADSCLGQARAMDPDRKCLPYQMNLFALESFVNEESGHFADAIGKMEQFLQQEDGVRLCDASVISGIYSLLSGYYSKCGQTDKALACARKCIDMSSGPREKNAEDEAIDLYRLAAAYRSAGKPREAMEINHRLTRVLERLSPDWEVSMFAWNQRGLLYYELEKYPQSLHALLRTEEMQKKVCADDHYGRLILNLCIARTLDAMKNKAEARERVCAVMPVYRELQKQGFILQDDLKPVLKYAETEE